MMKLERAYLDNCTIGKLYRHGQFLCYTVERPWLSNRKSISCIPPGEYKVEPYESPTFGDVFFLQNKALGVSLYEDTQRTAILIHPANFPHQLEGCIAPGLELNPDTWGVARSKDAMRLLKTYIFDSILIK